MQVQVKSARALPSAPARKSGAEGAPAGAFASDEQSSDGGAEGERTGATCAVSCGATRDMVVEVSKETGGEKNCRSTGSSGG